MKMLQIRCGVQYIVQKDLSDELSHVDFDNSNFEDIAWPAPSIEFFFEDPELPSIVVAHSRYDGFVFELAKALYGPEYASTLPGHARFREPALGAVCDNVGALTSCTVVHNFETWNEALESKGDLVPALDPDATHKQSKQEAVELHHMLNLSMKVLAYSNIPQFKPSPVTRKQMGRGPKPGVCGRPTRPSYRTIYLPRIVRTASMMAPSEIADSKQREFRGRRGHIRHLKSDYFVNKKGTWIYVPPVVVEGAERDVIYKVRKA